MHGPLFPVAAMLFAYALWLWNQRTTYVCPQCGTDNPREHADSCSWAQHYEDS